MCHLERPTDPQDRAEMGDPETQKNPPYDYGNLIHSEEDHAPRISKTDAKFLSAVMSASGISVEYVASTALINRFEALEVVLKNIGGELLFFRVYTQLQRLLHLIVPLANAVKDLDPACRKLIDVPPGDGERLYDAHFAFYKSIDLHMNAIGKQLQESRCGLSTNFALYGSYCCQAAIAIVTITTLVIGFMGSLSLELVVLSKLAVAIGVVIIVLDYIRRKMSYVLSLCTPVVDGKIIGMALLVRDIIAVRNSLAQEIVRFIWAWKEIKRVMRQPLPQDAPAKRPSAVAAQKQRFLSSHNDTVFSQGGKLVIKADSLASGLGWKGVEFATTDGSPVTGILMQETIMVMDSGVSSASDLSGGRSSGLQLRSSGSSIDPLD